MIVKAIATGEFAKMELISICKHLIYKLLKTKYKF